MGLRCFLEETLKGQKRDINILNDSIKSINDNIKTDEDHIKQCKERINGLTILITEIEKVLKTMEDS